MGKNEPEETNLKESALNKRIYTYMMRLLSVLTVAVFVSCSSREKEEDEVMPSTETVAPQEPRNPIVFNSMSSTRAATPLTEIYNNFGVWAWKGQGAGNMLPLIMHGDTDPVLPYFVYSHEKYAGNGSSQQWGYDQESVNTKQQYLRYWDLSCSQYDFYAYSPYNATVSQGGGYYPAATASGRMSYAMDAAADHKLSIAGITANFDIYNPDGNINWLWAKTRRTMSPLEDVDLIDPTNIAPVPPSKTATVPLAFHHILAKVKFCVKYRNQGEATLTSYVKTFSVTTESGFAATADFSDVDAVHFSVVAHTDPSYSFSKHPAEPIPFSATKAADNVPADITPWMAVIPEQAYVMLVHLTISEYGLDRPLVTTIEVPVDDTWQMDKQYTYTLIVDPANFDLNVAVHVADWEDGGEITPPVQTGW